MVTDPDDKSATEENLIVEKECAAADCIQDNPSNKIVDIDEVNVVIDESSKDDEETDTSKADEE